MSSWKLSLVLKWHLDSTTVVGFTATLSTGSPTPLIQKPRFWDTLRVPRIYPEDTCESTVLLFSRSVMSDSLWPHGLQHDRLYCLSLSSRACSDLCPLSWWCHTTILSSVPFSSWLQSFPASGYFLMSRLFASGIGVSSWRRQWHPTPVLLLGKSHGWRSLVGCSPWGHKESDTTERLHFHFSLSCIGEGNGNPL